MNIPADRTWGETEVTDLRTLIAAMATDTNRSWIYLAIAALVCVLAGEAVCIAFLVRRMLAARNRKKTDERENGTSLSGFAALSFALAGGVVWSSEVWLVVLAALALAGALALAVLIPICRAKGCLFGSIEEEEAKPEMPQRTETVMREPTDGESVSPVDDADRAIAAFAESEPAIEEPETVEEPERAVEAAAPEEDDEPDDNAEDRIDDDGDFDEDSEINDPDHFTGNERVIGFDEETGCSIVARYRKSFEAKLIQSQSHIKKYYSGIKNALLAYKGSKSRISWTADSFHNGRTQIAKINVKTRILELYLALDPATLDGSVYRGQDVGALKKYEETPFRYKIRTPRKFNWALELVRRVCEEHGLSPIDIEPVDYAKQYPFDTIDHLVERKLVKVTTRLEKPATSFELAEEPDSEKTTEKTLPARTDLSWKYSDENEPIVETEQLAADVIVPEEEKEPSEETVRITQIRYTERYGEGGEAISVTDRVVTDAPADAVVEESEPSESEEPATRAAFAEGTDADFVGKSEEDPLSAAFGEAHPENVWSEETDGGEADRMNGEDSDEPWFAESIEAEPEEEEPIGREPEWTEEPIFAEDLGTDGKGLASLFASDEKEPIAVYETDGDAFAEDDPAPASERLEETLAEEEPAYADPHYEEIRVEDLRQDNRSYAQPSFEERPEESARPVQAPAYEPTEVPAWREESPRPTRVPDADRSDKKKQVDPDLAIVDVGLLDINFEDGDVVTLEVLRRRGLVLPSATRLKIRARSGQMHHALTVVANQFTYDALLAIGGAGGETQFIR